MKLHRESHLDHGLTQDQIAHLVTLFAERTGFFIETITLPRELGTVPCGLYGPTMGDPVISESEVHYAARGARAWSSRLVDLPSRPQCEVTVIAGPHDEPCCSTHEVLRIGGCNGTGKTEHAGMHAGAAWHEEPCSHCNGTGTLVHPCILFTAFGGPLTPQEVGDPSCKDPTQSATFWRTHALAK